MPMEHSYSNIQCPETNNIMPEETVALEDALNAAFSLEGMKRMLRRQLGIILEDELDIHRGKKYIVGDLLQLAVSNGWRDDLVRGALVDNPGNPKLKKAAATLKVSAPMPASPETTAAMVSVRATDLDQGMLEKLARERGVMVKFEEYTSKLSAMASSMCSIEVPTGTAFGTGWLVASNLALTNYHVVEEVKNNAVAASDVTCRFDYFKEGNQGVACGLAGEWLLDWSPYALADQRSDAPEPTIEELDYALIRLARAVGDEDAAGKKRGWITVQKTPPAVIAEDIVMVPQFPDGRSLELSFGKALAYNESATRLRYDANTEEGASGSPALTMALEPFGLHHAGGPGRSQKYNQCVPLRLIIQRMMRQNKPEFWR
jgi:hypothetical protein